MYINTFKYTPKDVSCQLCTEYVKKLGCTALRCPWLAERIEAGVVGYREAVMETFPRDRRLSSRLNLLIKHYPGSLWSNEQHECRMQYQCAVQGYRRRRDTNAYYAAMYLLTSNDGKKHIIVLAGLLLPLVAFFAGNLVFTSISFACFLIAVPQVERMKSIFECKLTKRLGAVSFGIYALHWPIINSIGCWFIIAFTNRLRSDVVMLMALLCCVSLTLILAALFRMTVEKLTARVCKIIH